MELIIGNKNYSSWSLRGWLMLKAFGIEFKEHKLSLGSETFYATLKAYNPMAKVPVLIDRGQSVCDSLAICEYINEQYLDGKAWPVDPLERAKARALTCEMHAGFFAIRNEMPMNCRARRRVELSAQAQAEISRLDQLWAEQLQKSADKGAWLFGEFSIADVFFAPVALRCMTYQIELSPVAQQYVDALLDHPGVKAWCADAAEEHEVFAEDEAGEPV